MGCGYISNKTNKCIITLDNVGSILYTPYIINTNERYKMDTTDKLINTAKRLALQEMINKIKEEIEKLEREEEDADKIPF